MPPKGSTQRGYPSGRFFGDFLIGEKVTLGAEHGFAMLSRSACIGEGRGYQLRINSPGVQGGAPASVDAGATSSA